LKANHFIDIESLEGKKKKTVREVNIKKLHLSTTNKNIAGVCGGLGETFGLDPLLIRITFLILVFVNGIGLVLYLMLLLILPRGEQNDKEEIDVTPQDEVTRKLYRLNKGKMIAGICSGMERFFGIDVSLIRIIFVIVTLLTSGLGILIYIVLWLILPLEYE